MDAILQPFKELEELHSIQEKLKSYTEPIYISGCIDSQKSHLVYGIGINNNKINVIITYSELRAKEIYEDIRFYTKNVYMYPAKDIIFYSANIHSNSIVASRINVIKRIIDNEPTTIILTIDACIDKLISKEKIISSILKLEVGKEIPLSKLLDRLVCMGYERVEEVEYPSQFAVRGGIIDIYPLTSDSAFRIEFWDNEVDSIRNIDISSQRSIEKFECIDIYPASEIIVNKEIVQEAIELINNEKEEALSKYNIRDSKERINNIKQVVNELVDKLENKVNFNGIESLINYLHKDTNSIFEYFDRNNTIMFLDEPKRLVEKCNVITEEFNQSMLSRLEKGYILKSQLDIVFNYDDIVQRISKHRLVMMSTLVQNVKNISKKYNYNINVKSINSYNNSFEMLIKDLNYWINNKKKIILLAGSKIRAERLTADLQDREINAIYSKDFKRIVNPGEIIVGYGNVHKGFEYPLINYIIISESDVFGKSKKKKRSRNKYEGKKIQSFSELAVGDYVVHENHGLGIFKGIEKIEVEGIEKDYIKIEYRDEGNLYVSINQLNIIQKYIGAENRKPKLNKLGSSEWKKTKKRVKKSVENLAKELVSLYARRQSKEGYIYGIDTVWQKEFEEMFPFEETVDQITAIEDTKKDMESSKIMDRLICGDVGYGKTEVAIRAAFKAVQDSKQVSYLVPTTILAQQQYNNFVQRMKDFPVKVDILSRFRTPKQQRETIEGLKKGTVDIVIGTHRIVSKDIEFKDLGLLIVDEEQRFGVKHKEKIKQMKDNIDVLTLTATPIPRTLHMSLIGIRDMSVLEEPPEERMPIQTYVFEYNEEMIREAIVREISRKGQVYYVFNRVKNIDEITDKISRLVPDAVVTYAHGQMKERELEQIMYDFINGEIDVLVATTIIETGLDISNVNTIIIDDADKMGLSQLYQLRGRVGRSNRMAYAYLCYKRNKVLKETAEKRLQAIKEFTEFGSGFKIAMRDLEIRGAGNLLGSQQHGEMEAVGYDMYCKLLDEAIRAEKNEDLTERFNTTIEININAFIPSRYIKNEKHKLDIYKRISLINSQEDYYDMQEELEDRFGDLPKAVNNLLEVAFLKVLANKVYIFNIEDKIDEVTLEIHPTAKYDLNKLKDYIQSNKHKISFVQNEKSYFRVKKKNINNKQILKNIKEILQEFNKIVL